MNKMLSASLGLLLCLSEFPLHGLAHGLDTRVANPRNVLSFGVTSTSLGKEAPLIQPRPLLDSISCTFALEVEANVPDTYSTSYRLNRGLAQDSFTLADGKLVQGNDLQKCFFHPITLEFNCDTQLLVSLKHSSAHFKIDENGFLLHDGRPDYLTCPSMLRWGTYLLFSERLTTKRLCYKARVKVVDMQCPSKLTPRATSLRTIILPRETDAVTVISPNSPTEGDKCHFRLSIIDGQTIIHPPGVFGNDFHLIGKHLVVSEVEGELLYLYIDGATLQLSGLKQVLLPFWNKVDFSISPSGNLLHSGRENWLLCKTSDEQWGLFSDEHVGPEECHTVQVGTGTGCLTAGHLGSATSTPLSTPVVSVRDIWPTARPAIPYSTPSTVVVVAEKLEISIPRAVPNIRVSRTSIASDLARVRPVGDVNAENRAVQSFAPPTQGRTLSSRGTKKTKGCSFVALFGAYEGDIMSPPQDKNDFHHTILNDHNETIIVVFEAGHWTLTDHILRNSTGARLSCNPLTHKFGYNDDIVAGEFLMPGEFSVTKITKNWGRLIHNGNEEILWCADKNGVRELYCDRKPDTSNCEKVALMAGSEDGGKIDWRACKKLNKRDDVLIDTTDE